MSRVEKLKAEIFDTFKDINFVYNDCSRYDTLERLINEMTADVVEVVHGEWVVCDAPPPTWWYECSICHKAGNVEYNYCPNCGADMRGGNDDSEMCTIGKGKETMSNDPDMSCQAY